MKTGYCNGSDLLLFIGGKAVGHCTQHSVSISAETKDRAVKPLASKGISAGLWRNKGVVGLSVSISAEGLYFYEETESGYKTVLPEMMQGKTVQVKCCERNESDNTTPGKEYLSGTFVITKLDQTAPAQDDATYSIELENDGEVTYNESAITPVNE